MSTMEKLFVRIFERKRWIVDQLKQHSDLYDQSLASKCLIHGIQPPSWLLQSGFQGGSADFKELKKEDLISGLLFPPPRPHYPTASCHKRPLFSESNVQYSDTLYTGTCASEKDLDVRDRLMLVPNCHLNEATSSLPDQKLATLSDTNSQLDAPRERIQRSTSRQKTRNYEQVKSEKKQRESYRSGSAGRITRSRTSSGLQTDTLASPRSTDAVDRSIQVSECHLPEGTVSPPHQTEAKFPDINSQQDNSLERIHRCRSPQTIPVPLNNDGIQSEKKRKKSCSRSIGGRIKRFRTSSGLRTDTRAQKKSFDAGNSSMEVSECHKKEAISSPPYHTVARLSDTNLQLYNSVARIRRSSSGKKSSVPLTTGEGKSEQKRNEIYNNAIAARITRSRTSSGLRTDAHGLEKSFDEGDSSMWVSESDLHKEIVSPPRKAEARSSDVNSQLDNSLARVQRSRSRQKALVLRSVEVKSQKRPYESQLRGDVNRDILNLDMDPVKISFGETSAQALDVADQVEEICAGERDAEANKVLVVSNEIGPYPCDEKLISPDFNHVANSSSHQTHEITSRDHVPEYTRSSDAGTRIISSHVVTPKSGNIDRRPGSPYLLRNSMEPENQDTFFMSDELSLDVKSLQARLINNNAPDNSWPQCKRRKIEDRSSNIFTTSPILIRSKRLKKIDRNVISELHRHVQYEVELNHVSMSSDVEAAHLNVNDRSGGKLYHSAKHHRTENFGRTPSIETKEGDQDMEDGENGTNMSMGLTERKLETSLVSRLKNECENAQDYALESTDVNTSLLTSVGQTFPESVLSSQKRAKMGSVQDTESVIEDWLLSSSVRSLNFEDLDRNAANQSMPVFERFSVGMPAEKILSFPGDRMGLGKVDLPSTTSERISVLERLCRYRTIHSSLSDSSEPKNHTIPDVYPSTPNGNLDCTDMANGVPLSNGEFKQLESNYTLSSAEPDRASYSGGMPPSDVELDIGMGKPPFTPPVRMLGQRITSVPAHHSFEKAQSVNPELMCFPIDEDTCTSEENGTLDEVADTFHEDRSPPHSISEENGTLDEVASIFHEDRSPRHSNSLSNRIPLVDMTNSENLMSISMSKTVPDRGSINSVNTEPYMHRSQIKAKQNLRNTYGQDRGGRKDKENQKSLVCGNGVGNCSVKTRLSSRKVSSESQSFLGMGPKRGNIISNVSSFVPLVQQKQKPAAFATGKRDVKVKALEAAEAAKRLEEKKEHDRKMKKAAAKLERARIEEAKMKQLELKQKKEVEERKKKESEMAARKRLREDDDRKENERKRKCFEDKKDQLKVRSDKEKDKRRKAADVREDKENMQTFPKTLKVAAESVAQTISEVYDIVKDSNELVVNNLFDDDAKNRMLLLSEGNGEPSYDISPYQVSDDEKEDDDEEEEHRKRKKKFIPSWAREKSLASIMPYMEQVDPCKIFPPTRVCNIATVLSVRNSR